ncbi:hypothetical protein B0H19DRAFT_1077166 [Mycena capillaripes]|nr:hypothetical protein B0H19DRAFT_1077166 [Mycena capillaripes]
MLNLPAKKKKANPNFEQLRDEKLRAVKKLDIWRVTSRSIRNLKRAAQPSLHTLRIEARFEATAAICLTSVDTKLKHLAQLTIRICILGTLDEESLRSIDATIIGLHPPLRAVYVSVSRITLAWSGVSDEEFVVRMQGLRALFMRFDGRSYLRVCNITDTWHYLPIHYPAYRPISPWLLSPILYYFHGDSAALRIAVLALSYPELQRVRLALAATPPSTAIVNSQELTGDFRSMEKDPARPPDIETGMLRRVFRFQGHEYKKILTIEKPSFEAEIQFGPSDVNFQFNLGTSLIPLSHLVEPMSTGTAVPPLQWSKR